MEYDRLIMTPEEVLKRVDENTIGVVPTLGVTFTGQYEPVKAVSDALDKLQQETGLDIPMHGLVAYLLTFGAAVIVV